MEGIDEVLNDIDVLEKSIGSMLQITGESSLNKLRAQVEAGFRRRDAVHITKVFHKFCNVFESNGGEEEIVARSNLRAALLDLDLEVTDEEAEALYNEFDTDNAEGLDLNEFILLVKRPRRLDEWARSLSLAEIVSDSIPRKLGEDPLRVLSQMTPDDLSVSMEALHFGLQRMLQQAHADLKEAFKANDARKQIGAGSGGSKFNVIAMSCGNISDFHAGIEARIGAPSLKFMEAMENEHCNSFDSDQQFETSNYHITTTPRTEWQIVVRCDPSLADMRFHRRIPSIKELRELPISRSAQLEDGEIVAVVIYTGPMFQVYNTVLRRWPMARFEEHAREGNLYSTSIFVLISAIMKIARMQRLEPGVKLYRGLGGDKAFPSFFHRSDPKGRKGILEWGFMSTTTSKEIAAQYSGIREGKPLPTIFAMDAGAVDRGAVISDFSQYPGEAECLFPPCTFLEPLGAEAVEVTPAGVVAKLHVRLNVNLKSKTCHELVSQKKQIHISCFEYLLRELEKDLWQQEKKFHERFKEDVAALAWGGMMKFNPVVDEVMSRCKDVLKRHVEMQDEVFLVDESFKSIVTEMLSCKQKAKSQLNWYLRDSSVSLMEIRNSNLKDVHNHFLAYLKRSLESTENIEEQKQIALEICSAEGVEFRDDAERSTLVDAAEEGRKSSHIHLLLAARANVNAVVGSRGMTPLLAAAENGHSSSNSRFRSSTVKLLLSSGADVNVRNREGMTAVLLAAKGGHTATVQELHTYKADLQATCEPEEAAISALKDPELFKEMAGANALMLAAKAGHTETVKALHSLGLSVDSRSRRGYTALHFAASRGRLDTVRALIALGLDLLAIDNDGATAIHGAAKSGHTAVLRELAEKGMSVHSADSQGVTALHHAAYHGHVETVLALVALGANVNLTEAGGATPLHSAAHGGHTETMSCLCSLGADVNATMADGTTPLLTAAARRHTQAVAALAALGANVNLAKADGATPLHAAAYAGDMETVNVLRSLGASLNAAMTDGTTLLHSAAAAGHTQTARALADLGANINATMGNGATPLHLAASGGHTDTAMALVGLGADVNAGVTAGMTPAAVAAQCGHPATAEALAALVTTAGAAVLQATAAGPGPP